MNGETQAHLNAIESKFERIQERLDGIDRRLNDFGLRLPPLERDKEERDDEALAGKA